MMIAFTAVYSLALLAPALAQKGGGAPKNSDLLNPPEVMANTGTGKYAPVTFFEDPGLKGHTIYRPKAIPPNLKTPILLWGNGQCLAVGNIMAPFLMQVASQGVTVIANGAIVNNSRLTYGSLSSYPHSQRTDMKTALDWAAQQASTEKYSHFDLSKVAAAGQSCGGFEAGTIPADSRIKTLGIFNSGSGGPKGGSAKGAAPKGMKGGGPALSQRKRSPQMMMGGPDASTYKVPTFFFLGCPSDMACQSGKADFSKLSSGVPGWIGSMPVGGHMGSYNEINGGKYGTAWANWVKWALLGDQQAASWFKGNGAESDGWKEIQRKDLDKIA